ncbi:MAG: phosphopyruvate hydratase [Planctomycetaceae bacterium]|nr:phosphopyruvate hydratase [Planctomycetaceae bacterium]
MTKISNVYAREVLDSRGKPTVEVEITCDDGGIGRAIVPSGASTGQAEALELRDASAERYDGQGVLQAVANVNDVIAPTLLSQDAADQSAIDSILLQCDDSPQKSQLGGNALLGVSLATAHAAAASKRVPLHQHVNDLFSATPHLPTSSTPRPALPLPMTNMISGGLHAGGNLDFQDVLIMSVGASDYRTGLEWIVRVYRRLGELLCDAGFEGRLVGDEGGYGPALGSNRQAVEFVVRATEAAKLRPGEDVTIALDVAATHFVQEDGSYRLVTEQDTTLTSSQMTDRLEEWVTDFPITSIEDGLAEEDWEGWREMTKRLGDKTALVGDDLFTTNESRIRRGIELGVGNAVLIKVNQIGTLTETFCAISAARQAGYGIVVSARSGETEDTTIADLAVGVAADHIKIGSIVRSERLAKYNQLLRIAESLR